MVVHEAEIFPNVVTPPTARQDRERLHSDLGTHVLSNFINTTIKVGGQYHIPDTSMSRTIDCSSSRHV